MSENKTVLLTGATGSIGGGIAKLIARTPGYNLIIAARNKDKAETTVERLQSMTGRGNIRYVLADLSRKQEIKSLADQWNGPLHILINNAAVTPKTRQETPDGIECQWATNVLGYFWLISYLSPRMEENGASRIVNVASYWAGGLDLSDPEFRHRRYNNDSAYRQSKQADRMLSVAFSGRLKEKRITVNACHPGDVRSTLASNLGFGGHETPEQAADTPFWLATSPDVENVTGKYFEHRHETSCRFGSDREAVEELFRVCSRY